jgi:glycine dehydrogenase subunit 1
MPFIPHSEDEVREMLAAVGASDINALFEEIPEELRQVKLERVPETVGEMEITRLMQDRASEDQQPLCFVGAGAYDHHIPAAVWELTTRGEYYSAYTPYQAEASQGTLQLVYEYQTMMCGLTGMEVSNASLYDGATALAEAVLMAVRSNRRAKSKRILMPRTLHPYYRLVVETIVNNQGLSLELVDYDHASGALDSSAYEAWNGEDIAAVVVQQPNFFGRLEDVDAITDCAHKQGALLIGVANPTALAVIQPPGEWGEQGADIACGDGQPLGIPLSSGGPYFGYLACRQKLVRQMPGRLIGKTQDMEGREGYTLTLQPREQHIRRSKATSNICTNQGLMVTAATIYMSLLGAEGLERVAGSSHANTRRLVEALTAIDGVEPCFDGPVFHEAAVRLPVASSQVLDALAAEGILGGYRLDDDYPELGPSLLVCATEKRTEADIEAYASALKRAVAQAARA